MDLISFYTWRESDRPIDTAHKFLTLSDEEAKSGANKNLAPEKRDIIKGRTHKRDGRICWRYSQPLYLSQLLSGTFTRGFISDA